MSDALRKGEFVTLGYGESTTIPAEVCLASDNGRSLMLLFDGVVLDGHLGSMPVLQGDDGVFRSLFTGQTVYLFRRTPRSE